MKKYLMIGAAALTIGGAFISCTKDKDLYDPTQNAEKFLQDYASAFQRVFGTIDSNNTWGFGNSGASSRMTRSVDTPEVADIDQPYDETWVANYNLSAYEPNSENVTQNAKNFQYPTWQWSNEYNTKRYTTGFTAEEQAFYNENILPYENGEWGYAADAWYEVYKRLVAGGYTSWANVTAEPTFVLNFKITGTYDGDITVAATEGYTDGVANGNERTVVVTGTWNITADQRIGSLGKIIVANGGVVNVAEGKTLSMVNEARLVVLPGGKLTGAGSVEVNNGNAVGLENYNGGTIDVAKFNNNFGKFYNYGKFLVTEYQGGAQESNFYNHSIVSIKHTGLGSETPNARIFNACQWYCEGDMRCRNYEGIHGSSFIVGGQLMVSGSEDGTTTPTYFALAAGALVKVGSLYNNGTSWSGPTSGYAALEIVNQIDFLNWEQDAPQNGGYFENNIYVKCGTWENVPDGNGQQQKTDNGTEYYTMSQADYKFWQVVANCRGNNGVTKVEDGDVEVIEADSEFQLGVKGCTPGFKKSGEVTPPAPQKPSMRVIAEDISAQEEGDFDFNDVVFDVQYVSQSQVTVTIKAAGGTLPLYFMGNYDKGTNPEVHALYIDANPNTLTDQGTAIDVKTMINTQAKNTNPELPYTSVDGLADIVLTFNGFNNWSDVQSTFEEQVRDNIIVEVAKEIDGTTTRQELRADRGEAPAKVGVPTTHKWAMEKVYVGDKFKTYVGNANFKWTE